MIKIFLVLLEINNKFRIQFFINKNLWYLVIVYFKSFQDCKNLIVNLDIKY